MARNVSDEELQLKKRARRRLVGAVVLVTVVAVVLPMILDSEPKPTNQDINIRIPSPDAGILSGKPLPLKPADIPAKPVENSEPKPEPKPEAKPEPKAKAEAKPKPEAKAKVEAKPEAKAETKPITQAKPAAKEPAPKPPAAKAKPAAAETFAVQVIALSDAERAKAIQQKIVAGGMKAYTEVVQAASGPVTRVRVGPYASRDAAEKARQQLLGMKLDGKVVPLQ